MSTVNFGITADQRSNPSVARFLRLRRDIMQSLRVALPGIVQEFYPATQTVDVLIATNEYDWFTSPPQGSNANPPPINIQTSASQLPLLYGIPVFIPNGGGLNLTFPITKGDECVVLFCDTPFWGWFQSGKTNNNPIDQRRHSLSDGIAIFGVRSTPRVLPSYSTTSAQLRTDDGATLVDIKSGTITVTAATVNVNATNATVNGSSNVTIAGSSSVTISTNTKIDGKTFLTHTHSGVQAGGADTGPVV